MFFWLRNIIISVVLLGLAYFLLANQEELFPSDEILIEEVSADESQPTPPATPKKKSNSAADGLSKFYANLHGSADDDGPRIINDIVYLSAPTGNLEKILEAKRMVTRPLLKSWDGTKFSRAFRKGETLYQKLSQYAEKDGLEVIWWLDRDYVVKDPFRINHDIIKTAKLIGQAIEGHFMDGLSSYFCYQQRTIVMISGSLPYLDEECLLLSPAY